MFPVLCSTTLATAFWVAAVNSLTESDLGSAMTFSLDGGTCYHQVRSRLFHNLRSLSSKVPIVRKHAKRKTAPAPIASSKPIS